MYVCNVLFSSICYIEKNVFAVFCNSSVSSIFWVFHYVHADCGKFQILIIYKRKTHIKCYVFSNSKNLMKFRSKFPKIRILIW